MRGVAGLVILTSLDVQEVAEGGRANDGSCLQREHARDDLNSAARVRRQPSCIDGTRGQCPSDSGNPVERH